ncbi:MULTISPECIES: hypothetical protein [Ehrlichia]|uniref:Uncharacterized protein n=1 Tax=Ehrlichia cf. muris str. EmCRT TaxID=1359167 RepID=A0A0F3NCS4_9RICK|nr:MULTISPECIES: hypothetical protein [Ehrlichia]KJV65835.1 hypothetical protein EMUCRT_0015 [Ehrlichia cf. muris str. EmCRT]OUC04316.1 hypothetical protein DB91_03040 [Ehrlichia sp. Wisconsin_h]
MTFGPTIQIFTLVSLFFILITSLVLVSLRRLLKKHQLLKKQQPPVLLDTNIHISQEKLPKLMCGISNENLDAGIIRGAILSNGDFGKVKSFIVNHTKIIPESFSKDYDRLSKMVQNDTQTTSYDSLTLYEQTILTLAKKHIKSIKATLNVDDTEKCHDLFYGRATTAAILEHVFQNSDSLIPNTNIIHELVSYCNSAGYYSMPLRFVKEIFKKCQEIDMNQAKIEDISVTLNKATYTSLNYYISANVIIPYKGRDEKLLCSLDFTITSPDSQNFSGVCHKNMTLKLCVPDTMDNYITPLSPANSDKFCVDSAALTHKYYNNYKISLIYSLPHSPQIPSLINKQNFKAVYDSSGTSIQHYLHTTQQHC